MEGLLFYSSLIVPLPLLFWPKMLQWVQQCSRIVGIVSGACLYFGLAALQVVQHFYACLDLTEVWPGIEINVGSSILYPLGLAVLLHLAILRSPKEFWRVCGFLVGVNAVMAGITCLVRLGLLDLHLPSWGGPLWTKSATSQICSGTALLLIEALFLKRWFRDRKDDPLALEYRQLLIPLCIVLVFDAILFSLVVASSDLQRYPFVVLNQTITKLVAASIYSAVLHWYFRRLAAHSDDEPACWRESTESTAVKRLTPRAIPCNARYLDWSSERTIKDELMSGKDATACFDEAIAAFRADLPHLLENHKGKWVAYVGKKQVGLEPTQAKLLANCAKLDRDSLFVSRIVPDPARAVILGI